MASNPLSTLGTIFVNNENQGTTIVVSDHIKITHYAENGFAKKNLEWSIIIHRSRWIIIYFNITTNFNSKNKQQNIVKFEIEVYELSYASDLTFTKHACWNWHGWFCNTIIHIQVLKSTSIIVIGMQLEYTFWGHTGSKNTQSGSGRSFKAISV